jgi:hypothetical protein
MVAAVPLPDAAQHGQQFLFAVRRHDALEDRAAHHLRGAEAEQALGGLVPVSDDAVQREGEDGVLGRLDQRCQAAYGALPALGLMVHWRTHAVMIQPRSGRDQDRGPARNVHFQFTETSEKLNP